MPSKEKTAEADHIRHAWPLASSVTLGSAARSKGIERGLRRQLPWALRKYLTVEAGRIVLTGPVDDEQAFQSIRDRIEVRLPDLPNEPIIPSEIEDILSISARERHKWLADGRLVSAGTRTVKLRGRAKKVTFHVFDPRHVEDVLNADLPELWREDDARVAADNRKRAAAKAAMRRAAKRQPARQTAPEGNTLEGWHEFDADGLLR